MIFVFDENFPMEFVHGLAILEKANRRSKIQAEIIFSPEAEGCGNSVDDEVIIEAFSKKDAVIVTHDQDFKKVKHYKQLLIDHQVGYIIFRVPKSTYQYWDIVKAFVNKWEELKAFIVDSTHPFALEINKVGQINKLKF